MRKTITLVGIYAVLLVNIALGFWMFFRTYELLMTVVRLLDTDSVFGPTGSMRFEEAVNGVTVVIMACLAVVFVPLLEHYYAKNHHPRVLSLKITRVLGVQFLYIGIMQVLLQVVVSAAALRGTGIDLQTVVVLAIGVLFTALRWWLNRQRQPGTYHRQVAKHA